MTEYNNAPEWFRPYAEAQAQLLAELGLKKKEQPKEDKTDEDEARRAAMAWAKNLPEND